MATRFETAISEGAFDVTGLNSSDAYRAPPGFRVIAVPKKRGASESEVRQALLTGRRTGELVIGTFLVSNEGSFNQAEETFQALAGQKLAPGVAPSVLESKGLISAPERRLLESRERASVVLREAPGSNVKSIPSGYLVQSTMITSKQQNTPRGAANFIPVRLTGNDFAYILNKRVITQSDVNRFNQDLNASLNRIQTRIDLGLATQGEIDKYNRDSKNLYAIVNKKIEDQSFGRVYGKDSPVAVEKLLLKPSEEGKLISFVPKDFRKPAIEVGTSVNQIAKQVLKTAGDLGEAAFLQIYDGTNYFAAKIPEDFKAKLNRAITNSPNLPEFTQQGSFQKMAKRVLKEGNIVGREESLKRFRPIVAGTGRTYGTIAPVFLGGGIGTAYNVTAAAATDSPEDAAVAIGAGFVLGGAGKFIGSSSQLAYVKVAGKFGSNVGSSYLVAEKVGANLVPLYFLYESSKSAVPIIEGIKAGDQQKLQSVLTKTASQFGAAKIGSHIGSFVGGRISKPIDKIVLKNQFKQTSKDIFGKDSWEVKNSDRIFERVFKISRTVEVKKPFDAKFVKSISKDPRAINAVNTILRKHAGEYAIIGSGTIAPQTTLKRPPRGFSGDIDANSITGKGTAKKIVGDVYLELLRAGYKTDPVSLATYRSQGFKIPSQVKVKISKSGGQVEFGKSEWVGGDKWHVDFRRTGKGEYGELLNMAESPLSTYVQIGKIIDTFDLPPQFAFRKDPNGILVLNLRDQLRAKISGFSTGGRTKDFPDIVKGSAAVNLPKDFLANTLSGKVVAVPSLKSGQVSFGSSPSMSSQASVPISSILPALTSGFSKPSQPSSPVILSNYKLSQLSKPSSQPSSPVSLSKYTLSQLSKPSRPSQPSAPSQPSSPSRASRPSSPSSPSRPSAPSQPSAPSEASKPSEPSKPSSPSQPSKPSSPSRPSRASTPSRPSRPSTPSRPSQPSRPSTPSKPSEPTPLRGETRILLPELELESSSMVPINLFQGYNVFARRKGKDSQLNEKALTKKGATGLGHFFVENTVRRSFYLRPSKETPVPSPTIRVPFKQYRRTKGKTKLQPDSFVELPKYAINTLGEKRQLSEARFAKGVRSKGILALINKKLLGGKKRKLRRKSIRTILAPVRLRLPNFRI